MKYKLQLLDKDPIKPPVELGLQLQDVAPGTTETFVAPTECGSCGGIDAPEGVTIAADGTTTLTFSTIDLDLGPYAQSAEIETDASTEEEREALNQLVHWYITQTAGDARTPTVTALGPNVADGISIVFDPDVEGSYSGVQFQLTISRPDPWVGGEGARNFACDTKFIEGEVIDTSPYLTVESGFDWGSGAGVEGFPGNPYVAWIGSEPPDPWTATFKAHNLPSGFATWTMFANPGSVWNVTLVSTTADTITVTGNFVGGAEVECLYLHAEDLFDSGIVAPLATEGLYSDGDATIKAGEGPF